MHAILLIPHSGTDVRTHEIVVKDAVCGSKTDGGCELSTINIERTACPNVYRFAIGLFLEHFGRQVTGSAGETEPRLLVALNFDGQAEVGQLDSGTFCLARQQQVFRLQEAYCGALA